MFEDPWSNPQQLVDLKANKHWGLHHISLFNVEVSNDFVNKSGRLSLKLLNINFTNLLEFMCIKEFWRNVFSSISFYIISFDMSNA